MYLKAIPAKSRSLAMGRNEQWVKEFVSRQIPRPSGSDSILHRLLLIFLGRLLGPNHQLESISIWTWWVT